MTKNDAIDNYYKNIFNEAAKNLIAHRRNPARLRDCVKYLITFTEKNQKTNTLTAAFIRYHTFHIQDDDVNTLAEILHERAFKEID